VSEKLYRDKIAAIKKQQGSLETTLAKARTAATKHRSDAAKERAKITPRTSDSMARMHQRAAEAADKRVTAEDGKVATLDLPPGGGHRGYAAMVDGSGLMAACCCSHSTGDR
jgi:hypothetical protein